MNAKPVEAAPMSWQTSPERTSQADDERIKDITVLPPPEHLIRFFPIRGTPVEALIRQTRRHIRDMIAGKDIYLTSTPGDNLKFIYPPIAALLLIPVILGLAVAAVIREGKYVTYDLKEDRNDPTAVGTSEMADAIIAQLKQN